MHPKLNQSALESYAVLFDRTSGAIYPWVPTLACGRFLLKQIKILASDDMMITNTCVIKPHEYTHMRTRTHSRIYSYPYTHIHV